MNTYINYNTCMSGRFYIWLHVPSTIWRQNVDV